MKTQVSIAINASKESIWNTITDIENCANTIEAIQEVKILEKQDNQLVGLKWSEKRIMFGKKASETMWISEAETNDYYVTRAESHGSIYNTRVSIQKKGKINYLIMEFEGIPQTFGAKLMWGLMGFMFKGATKKALQKDLEDIKQVVEKK